MLDFEYVNPTKVAFGKNAMNQLAPYARTYAHEPAHRVLIISGGGSIHHNGIFDRVVREL